MKTIDLLLIGILALAAPASWASSEFGRFDWSIYQWMPGSLQAVEKATESSVVDVLSTLDDYANPEEPPAPAVPPNGRDAGCDEPNPSHAGVSFDDWKWLWERRGYVKQRWTLGMVIDVIGPAYCVTDDGLYRWLLIDSDGVIEAEVDKGKIKAVQLRQNELE